MCKGIRHKSRKSALKMSFSNDTPISVPAIKLAERNVALKELLDRVENHRLIHGDSEYLRRVENGVRRRMGKVGDTP